MGADSEKGDLHDRPGSFETYRSVEGTWRSVVASGRLESTTDDAIGTESLDGLDRVRIPLVDIFGKPSREVEFEFSARAGRTDRTDGVDDGRLSPITDGRLSPESPTSVGPEASGARVRGKD